MNSNFFLRAQQQTPQGVPVAFRIQECKIATAPARQQDRYITVERLVYLLDRSDFELGRNFCLAQEGNAAISGVSEPQRENATSHPKD